MEDVKKVYWQGWLSGCKNKSEWDKRLYWLSWQKKIADLEEQGQQVVVFRIPNPPGLPPGMLNGDAIRAIETVLQDLYGKTPVNENT